VLLDTDVAAALEPATPGTPSAVLVPLFALDDTLHAVFTQRRADLRNHAGQISFPGGRRDPGDPSLAATALREAHEEIGLDPAAVHLLGALQPTPTIATQFVIYPFVGLLASSQAWTPSAREVDEVFDLSLAELRAGYERRPITRRGVTFRTDAYVVEDRVVWGATARILADLYERLDAAQLG
jgi:8-oxo-dGTP pyrophosphatase MutT (NUDIX family)